jgi:hypothetical protein
MRRKYLLLIIFALLLAACAPEANEPGAQLPDVQETLEPAATEVASVVAPVLTPSSLVCDELPETRTEGEETDVTVPENAVIVYSKEGGFAGLMETWTIYADGQILGNEGQSLQAPPQVVDGLVSLAENVGFFDLKNSYLPENTCCDFFIYTLTVRNCEQVHSVVTMDDAPGTPEELWQILNDIQALLAATSNIIEPPSGTVDLDSITPVVTLDGETVTQPAPGTPSP